MLVIALIALLAMLGVSSFDYLHKILVHSDGERLYSLILGQRAQAMATGQQIDLHIDVKNGLVTGANVHDSCTNGVLFDMPSKTYGPPSKPTELLKNACTFVDNTIRIDPDGSINAGSLYLTDTQKTCCFALTVPTGAYPFLRLYRYDKKWHLLS